MKFYDFTGKIDFYFIFQELLWKKDGYNTELKSI